MTTFRGGVDVVSGNGQGATSAYQDAVIQIDTIHTAPTTTSGLHFLYVNSSNNLVFDNGSTTTVLGAAGSAATTWEAIFTNDSTMAISSGTWTITQSSANAILTLNKTNVGAGAVIDITNSGSGADITANSSAWSITTSGGVAVMEMGSGATLNATDGAITIGKTGTATTLSGTLTVAEAVTLTSGGVTVTSGNLTLSSGNLALTSGTFTVSAGLSTFISAANSGTILMTNNTATTYGIGGTSTGVALFRSTSLTTGTLMRLQLTEGTLNGGFYFDCWDVTAGAAVFSIAEDGVVIMAGTAGSNSFTMTAGDVVMSDGSLTITDADNAATLSLTNDTATTAAVYKFAGSGAFTGTTTSSFVTITPTGLTTGTALYIAAAAATTTSVAVDVTTSTTTGTALRLTTSGIQTDGASTGILTMVADSATTAGATAGRGLVSLSADALTTGTGVDITSTSITYTTGQLLNISHISGNITGTLNCTSAGIMGVDASRTVTTGTVADDYDLGSFIRTQTINGGGSFSAAGAVLYVQNVTTNTSGTITDTVKGIEVVMDADGTGTGVEITHASTTGKSLDIIASATTGTVALLTAASLTTSGVGLSIVGAGTGLTSGSLLRVSSGTTSAVATNGVVSFRATGAFTSTSNVAFVDVLASGLTGAGTVMRVKSSAASQTASEVMRVEAAGYTSGYSGVVMNVIGVATTGAAATTHSVLTVTGANTTGGNMIQMSNDALTTGVGFLFAHATSVIADGGSMLRLSSSSVDTGGATNASMLDIKSTGATAATVAWIADTALTTGIAFKVSGSAAYTGTGFINLAAATTTGVSMLLTNSALTTGIGLSVVNSSSNTGAWKGISSSVTNTAAIAAAPFRASNVAVNNSKFTRMFEGTDGTKTVTIWLSQDATTPNGTLSGTAGDICLNGPSNRVFYCTGTTNWTASNA